ncbi:MAG: archaeosine biosynthesis radical SAM protein RaSEA [Halobacteriota archaeon]|nr:archaeosine biosynthesis radical SAM protein RaSEA [Halobacteriota archaeon]
MPKPRDPRPNEPVGVWAGREIFETSPMDSVTVIFRTVGCYWKSCLMCGFKNDCSPHVTSEDLRTQIDQIFLKFPESEGLIVKIYTSGSFFDEIEVPKAVQDEFLTRLKDDARVRKVIIETLPEFVSKENISKCASLFEKFDIAMGIETSSDVIRAHCVNKNFGFKDFSDASDIAKRCGAGVKAYLLLKPPFLSERSALEDVVRSARDISEYASTISINLCNVQNFTKVHNLWQRGEYRPPWLWSAVEALVRVKSELGETVILSDPLASGQKRGPHNCGLCDRKVSDAIKQFSLTQDVAFLERLDCDCRKLYRKVIELEDRAFGAAMTF